MENQSRLHSNTSSRCNAICITSSSPTQSCTSHWLALPWFNRSMPFADPPQSKGETSAAKKPQSCYCRDPAIILIPLPDLVFCRRVIMHQLPQTLTQRLASIHPSYRTPAGQGATFAESGDNTCHTSLARSLLRTSCSHLAWAKPQLPTG